MQVHPDIAALRADMAAQRRNQAHMDAALLAWQRDEAVERIAAELKEYDAGADFAELPGLKAILTNLAAGKAFHANLVAHFAKTLRQHPLGEVPFSHNSSAGFARLQLMREGRATLSICVYEPIEESVPSDTAQFVDCAVREMVIAGTAKGLMHRISSRAKGRADIATRSHQWRAGDCIVSRAACDSREILRAQSSLVLLQLTRSPSDAQPTCEYRLRDGALVRQASGSKRASQQVMALAVLGAVQTARAGDAMASFAQDQRNDPEARWEAVRQIVASNSDEGMTLLNKLAQTGDDPLAPPARALQTRLIVDQPELRRYLEETS